MAGHDPDATWKAAPLAGIDDAVAVSLGGRTACALRRGGLVSCWGVVDDGRQGYNTMWNGSYAPRFTRTPQPIAGITATEVAAGGEFACAIVDGGSVACWGTNEWHVLGPSIDAGSLAPVGVDGIRDAVHIATGDYHACALRRDRTVTCWGGREVLGSQPARTPIVLPLSRVLAIAIKGERLYASLETGEVESVELLSQAPQADRTELRGVEAAPGQDFVCARRANGTVGCSGWGSYGQLGDGSATTAYDRRTSDVPGISDAVAIAAGDEHACALSRSGALRCWGANDAGQAGRQPHVVLAAPTRVDGISDVSHVAMAEQATCAVRRAGDVLCWGSGAGQSLGGGTPAGDDDAPDRATPALVPGVSDVTAIAGGRDHFCAVRRSGEVLCWGKGGSGTEKKNVGAINGLRDAVDVGAYADMSCALRRAGTVACWGGSFGHDLDVAIDKAKGAPVEIPGLRGAARLTVGYMFACAVRTDGSAACWGDRLDYEQLALPRRAVLAEVDRARDFVQLGVGDPDHVVLRSGDLLAFDTGYHFVRGARPPVVEAALPAVLLTSTAQVVQRQSTACARRASGEVDCWEGTTPSAPVGIDDAVDIALSEGHAFAAVRANGDVVCWGENGHGECGTDPVTIVASPNEVQGLPDGGS
jgi:alpha-tubulin suppressor-like RCC1 family protein